MKAAPIERVLILGAGGQLGRALTHAFSPTLDVLAATHRQCDLLDRQDLASLLAHFKPDVVLNAAAYTAVDEAERDPARAFAVNAEGPALLGRLVQSFGTRLVHYSTDYVFDGVAKRPYEEDDECRPLSVYGQSKRAGEEAVRGSGADALILRVSWLYGAGERNFVAHLVRSWHAGTTLPMVADQFGVPTHVARVARLTLALLARDTPPVLHCVSSGSTSRLEWARFVYTELERLTGQSSGAGLVPRTLAEVSTVPGTAPRPAFSVLSNRALTALGITVPDWRADLTEEIAARCGRVESPSWH